MNMRTLVLAAACASSAALAACGGGGGGGATPPVNSGGGTPPPSFAQTSSMNVSTAYTVYQGTSGGIVYLEIAPLGDSSAFAAMANVAAVPGAIVQYPDGSVQLADVLGNFDASQSQFALNAQNVAAFDTNPNSAPEVFGFMPGVPNEIPGDATVNIIPTSATTTTASHLRFTASAAATTELAGVTVFPRGYALFDTESRTYHAVGVDSSGTFASLAGATVAWSLAQPQGCPNPNGAGRVAALQSDPSRAVYTPPSNGTFSAGCQDEVVATVTANGASFSGSGNAFFYDPSTAATVKGVLSDSTGKPVAQGIVDFFGGGREFYHGKLYAVADANGNYSRLVPTNRTLDPFGGNPVTAGGKTTYTFFTVNPSSVAIGGAGSTTTQNLAETATQAVDPFKPLPPVERAIRDSNLIADIAQDGLPFGGVNGTGQFPAGSLEAVINNPGPANATGTVTSGGFKNWTFTWDATGTIVVFQQPAGQEGGRHVIQVSTLANGVMQYAVSVNGTSSKVCPASTTCFNLVEYYNPGGIPASQPSPLTAASLGNGTIVGNDGSFAENVDPQTDVFSIAITRNVYSVGHQTLGSPLYSHGGSFSQNFGSATISINDTWSDALGKQIATFTGTRIAGTSPVLFNYSGTGTRTFYKADGSQAAQIAFSLSNGTVNQDHSGGFKVTYNSGFPNASDNGTSVTWTLNASGNPRATGTVDNPNITGLQTADVATFALTPGQVVTVTFDPNLGGNVIAFHL